MVGNGRIVGATNVCVSMGTVDVSLTAVGVVSSKAVCSESRVIARQADCKASQAN